MIVTHHLVGRCSVQYPASAVTIETHHLAVSPHGYPWISLGQKPLSQFYLRSSRMTFGRRPLAQTPVTVRRSCITAGGRYPQATNCMGHHSMPITRASPSGPMVITGVLHPPISRSNDAPSWILVWTDAAIQMPAAIAVPTQDLKVRREPIGNYLFEYIQRCSFAALCSTIIVSRPVPVVMTARALSCKERTDLPPPGPTTQVPEILVLLKFSGGVPRHHAVFFSSITGADCNTSLRCDSVSLWRPRR
jgi:hypothetical protein